MMSEKSLNRVFFVIKDEAKMGDRGGAKMKTACLINSALFPLSEPKERGERFQQVAEPQMVCWEASFKVVNKDRGTLFIV
jgi:hypothetical protein